MAKTNYLDSFSDKKFQRDLLVEGLFDQFAENTVVISLIDDDGYYPCNECCWCDLP